MAHFQCAVVGDWHLAFVTAGALSRLGRKTLLVTTDGKHAPGAYPPPPVTEPGMDESIARGTREGTLAHAHPGGDWTADLVWIAIDTPVNERDEPDPTPILEIAKTLRKNGKLGKGPLVLSSQIAAGFSRKLEAEAGVPVVHVPENLRLGQALENFLRPDRLVIGATKPEHREQVKALLAGVEGEAVLCSLETAEMVKHATNAFLATSISFANELARIGEAMGADLDAVAKALKLDLRIGKRAYVAPGLGFAGGTLPRDLRALQRLGKEHRLPTPLADAVLQVNENAAQALVDVLARALGGDLKGKEILILGYAYKADIDTLRRSPGLDLAEALLARGARLYGFDPVMNGRDLSPLKGKVQHLEKWEEAPRGLAAAVLMTARPMFRALDWSNARGALVLDAVKGADGESVRRGGADYLPLWGKLQRAFS